MSLENKELKEPAKTTTKAESNIEGKLYAKILKHHPHLGS